LKKAEIAMPLGFNRRRLRFSIGIAVLLATVICLTRCVSTITPPPDPEEPCRVYLLKEGLHAGIVLPDSKGGFKEFGYGDWDWYALLADSWYNVFDTVLWPTQGCFGRRTIDADRVDDLVRSGRLHALEVNGSKVRSLLERLDLRFDAKAATMIHNRRYGLTFVEDDRSFWLFYNCNDSVAEWMTELDCEVSSTLIRTGIELE